MWDRLGKNVEILECGSHVSKWMKAEESQSLNGHKLTWEVEEEDRLSKHEQSLTKMNANVMRVFLFFKKIYRYTHSTLKK